MNVTDEVFEGAMAARENYCTSVISIGKGLKAKGTSAPPGPAVFNPAFKAAEPEKPKPQTSNACVGTEDLPYEPPTGGQPAGGDQASSGQPEKHAPSPDIDEDSDILSFFISWFFGSLVWIVKSILITFPMKAISFTLFSLISFVVLSMLWLQFVDDHGAGAMGASIDFMHNRPGIV